MAPSNTTIFIYIYLLHSDLRHTLFILQFLRGTHNVKYISQKSSHSGVGFLQWLFAQASRKCMSNWLLVVRELRRLLAGYGWGSKFGTTECRRPIHRNLKITNIKTTKDELFDSIIFEFIFSLFINYLHNLIIFQIIKYWFSKW